MKHNKAIVNTNNLQELSNFKKNTNSDKLMQYILQNSTLEEIINLSEKWKDFDYEFAIKYLVKSNRPEKVKIIMKMVIDDWNTKDFYYVVKKVGGQKKFRKILIALKDKLPDLFNYLVSKWPDIGVFLNG